MGLRMIWMVIVFGNWFWSSVSIGVMCCVFLFKGLRMVLIWMIVLELVIKFVVFVLLMIFFKFFIVCFVDVLVCFIVIIVAAFEMMVDNKVGFIFLVFERIFFFIMLNIILDVFVILMVVRMFRFLVFIWYCLVIRFRIFLFVITAYFDVKS